MSQGLSVALPLFVSDEDGAYEIHKELEKVAIQNLKMVILTSPGERVMSPDFGVGIRNYLFERNSSMLSSEIRRRTMQQVDKYVPMVKVLDLNVRSNPDEGFLLLSIKYSVPLAGIVSSLTIPVSS